MKTEVSLQIGAAPCERSPKRSAYRNGYRTHRWDTRVGTIELNGLGGHDGESTLSNGRDTCCVNIVWPHRTPWFIAGWQRGNPLRSVGWSAGQWAWSAIARLGEVSRLPRASETSPELFLGFGPDRRAPKETCWSGPGSK